ncbi:MAG TPA: hypothetical protein VGJ40_03600 [Gaiellaceae bacterium]|jgi:hypothetical protein
MKRLGCVSAFAVATLLLVCAPATAKELTNVAACGPDGCNNLSGPGLQDFPNLGEPTGTMPPPAEFYEVRFTIDADGAKQAWTYWYVPSAKMLALVDERQGLVWVPFAPAQLVHLTEGLEPFGVPEVTSVSIGTRKVTSDPGSYLRLFSLPSADSAIPQGLPDWEPIVFTSKRRSPWTSGTPSLYYSPAHGLLQRGIEIVRLPRWAAADVRAGDPLAPSGFPWRKLLLALAAAGALVAAAAAVRRLRRTPVRRQPTPA